MTLSQNEPKPPRKRQAEPQLDRPDLEELRDLVREAVLLSAAHLDIFQREDSHRKLRSILANVSDYHLLALLSERQQDRERIAALEEGLRRLFDANRANIVAAPRLNRGIITDEAYDATTRAVLMAVQDADRLLSSSGGDKE